ncbi:MAG: response regulator [Planctomycetota bacterium]
MIRVAIVDDHRLVREGFAALLHTSDDVTVVGHAADGVEALDLLAETEVDVLLLDLRMPEMDGHEVLRRLQEAERERPRALVLTTFDDDAALLLAARRGARGFLLKDTSRDELLEAIRDVHEGRLALRPAVGDRVRNVLAGRSGAPQEAAAPALTPRESDVLRLMAAGLTNREIADGLGLAEGTVKNHVSVILGKLAADDRTRAVLRAIELGLV